LIQPPMPSDPGASAQLDLLALGLVRFAFFLSGIRY